MNNLYIGNLVYRKGKSTYKTNTILKKEESTAKEKKIGIWSENKDTTNYWLLFLVIFLIIIGCLVNTKFRKKTETKVKREVKKQFNKEIKKMFR